MRGLPSSWGPTAVTLYSEIVAYTAIWSPCNRVIAIADHSSVALLDAATLSQLYTFAIPSQYLDKERWRPSFSPDSHCLTLIGKRNLISWDLQTGGPLGAIPSGLGRELEKEPDLVAFSSAYSEDGKVVVTVYSAQNPYAINHDAFIKCDTLIRTYDLSGTEAGPHCAVKGRIVAPIWTYGKCIRFVTINPGSVAISEVETLPIADKIVGGQRFLFLPSLSRLAFTLKDTIQVWDAKAAKLLLKSEFPSFGIFGTIPARLPVSSFSPNGRFFAHLDEGGVVHVWKESPSGYVLHQKLPFVTPNLPIQPHISPSGESILMSPDRRVFHLWHTRDQVPSLPSVLVGDVDENNFTLAFSPDESFAAFARRGGNVVTIFNPLTGDLQLAVDTDMGVVCLGMTGSALIIVGDEKIVTWDIPGGDCAFNASINDSVRTTTLDCSPIKGKIFTHMSISPDFSRIAVLSGLHHETYLHIYDMSRRCHIITWTAYAQWVGFTRDGREVWTVSDGGLDRKGWENLEDSEPGPIQLDFENGIVRPPGVFPWESRRGYEVTGDGWVLSATQRRLLWLPHRWRSQVQQTVWIGRFLGLLHKELSEVVILEFPE